MWLLWRTVCVFLYGFFLSGWPLLGQRLHLHPCHYKLCWLWANFLDAGFQYHLPVLAASWNKILDSSGERWKMQVKYPPGLVPSVRRWFYAWFDKTQGAVSSPPNTLESVNLKYFCGDNASFCSFTTLTWQKLTISTYCLSILSKVRVDPKFSLRNSCCFQWNKP